jgi:hypothetical protein
VRVFGGRPVLGRLYRVVIEITYVGGRLADEVRPMLAAEIRIPGADERRDTVITASPGSFTVIAVSATVDAANPRAALAVVDDALDRALMATAQFEKFDVTGKTLRVAPLSQAARAFEGIPGTETAEADASAGDCSVTPDN